MELEKILIILRGKNEVACDVAADLLVSYAKTSLKQYQEIEMLMNENKRLEAELAAYRTAEQDGTLLRLPFVAMVEQSMQDGKMKPQKDQLFNGRYAAVYHSSRWGCPLIDICGTPYNSEQATKRVAALKEQEGQK